MAATFPLAAVAFVAMTPWIWGARTRRRRWRALSAPTSEPALDADLDVTVLLELIAAAMRAGAGLPRALAAVAESVSGLDGAALAGASIALRRGTPWALTWADVPDRLRVVARALQPAWEEGAAPGPALAAAANDVRRARRDGARVAAGRLAVRLVLPLGACFLPSFVLVGLAPVVIALGGGVLHG
jgi:pilus assembly protein TadC